MRRTHELLYMYTAHSWIVGSGSFRTESVQGVRCSMEYRARRRQTTRAVTATNTRTTTGSYFCVLQLLLAAHIQYY